MSNTVFFVSSSDNTYDVFEIVGKRLLFSLPIDVYKIYVGLNSKNASLPFNALKTEAKGWMQELRSQLSQLPEATTAVILLLDDFWFHDPIPLDKLNLFIDIFDKIDADYLRLVPLKRSTIASIIRYFKKTILRTPNSVEKISESEPYYSSLQMAIWRRSYLEMLLDKNISIWDFEHLSVRDSKHFAVINNFFNYSHLVEKGKWYPFALKILSEVDDDLKLERSINKRYNRLRIEYDRLKFAIFGYSIFKIKKYLKNKI